MNQAKKRFERMDQRHAGNLLLAIVRQYLAHHALCDFGSQGCRFEPCPVQIKYRS